MTSMMHPHFLGEFDAVLHVCEYVQWKQHCVEKNTAHAQSDQSLCALLKYSMSV